MSKELINLDTKREQMTNQQKFPEDFEREALKHSLYLQADQYEKERQIMQEINEEEHRLPARITVINPKLDEFKDNTIPLRGTNQEELFSRCYLLIKVDRGAV